MHLINEMSQKILDPYRIVVKHSVENVCYMLNGTLVGDSFKQSEVLIESPSHTKDLRVKTLPSFGENYERRWNLLCISQVETLFKLLCELHLKL